MFRKLKFGMFPLVEDAAIPEVQAGKDRQPDRGDATYKARHDGHEHQQMKKEFKLPVAFFKPGHAGHSTSGLKGPKTFELKNYRFLVPKAYSKHKEKET